MGRNRIVCALSQVTFVVSSDVGSGGTWAGAKEALECRFARVAVWTGDGAKEANHALVARRSTPITDLTTLFETDPALPAPLQSSRF